MAPRGRFELPRRNASGFRDHRLTGLDYLGLSLDSCSVIYLSPDLKKDRVNDFIPLL